MIADDHQIVQKSDEPAGNGANNDEDKVEKRQDYVDCGEEKTGDKHEESDTIHQFVGDRVETHDSDLVEDSWGGVMSF